MACVEGTKSDHPQKRGELRIHAIQLHLAVFFCCWDAYGNLQASPQQSVIWLRDISNIERIDMKPYCLLLEANNRKYFLSLKNDEEVYGWLDDVYGRSPLMGVSNPTNFVHKVHVGFDPVSGAFTVCFPIFLHFFFLALIFYLLPGHARTMEQAVDEIGHHQGRLC